MKRIIIGFAVGMLSLFACDNQTDEQMDESPKIGAIEGVKAGGLVTVGTELSLRVVLKNQGETHCRWEINGAVVAEGLTCRFTPKKVGEYTIRAVASTPNGEDAKQLIVTAIEAPAAKSKWISEVLEYRPAPGQFINTSLGDLEAARSIVGKRGLVSLGGYGGTIVFRFDHSVRNNEGIDFVVLGNAFKESSEPGIVSVSFDANGNGIADDLWYELKGADYDRSEKGYTILYRKPSQTETAEDVPWSDNNAGTGVVAANPFHSQSYFPLFFAENPSELRFSGNRNTVDIVFDDVLGGWVLKNLGKGYVDNYSSDYTTVVGGDADTKNGNKFDISDAIDQNGNPVSLKSIDFIKVYTSVNQRTEPLGEVSTEVCGAVSLTK